MKKLLAAALSLISSVALAQTPFNPPTPWGGGYIGTGSNGPSTAFRTRSPDSNGSNDVSFFTKAGVQGFPVAVVQGWGTAGATRGAVGNLAVTNGGTGYNGGGSAAFSNVPLTGGHGSGAVVDLTVTSGVVTSIGVIYRVLGTGYVIGDVLSANNANLGGTGSGLQITVLAYSAGFAMDYFPWGAQVAANDSANGIIWRDMCNVDLTTFNVPTTCNHAAVFWNGDIGTYTSTFLGAVRRRNMFGDVTTGAYNWVYGNDDFHVMQGNVRGSGTSMLTTPANEEVSTNLAFPSNNFTGYTLTNATVGANGREDPWGTATASLITSTVSAGHIGTAVAVPNDGNPHTVSVYVNSASAPAASQFFMLEMILSGGTGITNQVVLTPSIGGPGSILATPPSGCLNNDGGTGFTGHNAPPVVACYGTEVIKVGCEVGCVSTGETWHRLWGTIANNTSGNTLLTVNLYPSNVGVGTAVIAGLQIEPRSQVTPYIPTVAAAVVRTPGIVQTKQFFTSSSVTGIAGGATQFYAVGCEGATQICQGIFPSSGTVRNLYTTLQTAPGGAVTNTMTLMAGTGATPGATTVTCPITGAAVSCNDLTHSARVQAGDTFNVRSVAGGGAAGSGYVTFAFELDTP